MLLLTDGHLPHASSRIRATEYIPYFKQEGFSVRWLSRVPIKPQTYTGRYFTFPLKKRLNRIILIFHLLFFHYDVVFIQRFFMKKWMLQWIKQKNARIIYDFDDAIYISDGKNNKAEKQLLTMIKLADEVIVSSPVLKTYCEQNGVSSTIVTTSVDVDRIFPKSNSEHRKFTIGWIGSEWTLKFLKVMEPVLLRLSEEIDFEFLIVGVSGYQISGVNTRCVPWMLESENNYLNQMDVGIMPLPDTEFEKGKGGYKLFQYMAAGIPVIASPVGINKDIVNEDVNGFLAISEEDWISSITLLTNKNKRKMLGENGRKKAVEVYSRRVCFDKIRPLLLVY
ncbi:MAG: glycosyltransferase [Bacteroidales bacterium]|nr:glycosyltransferase [Bacteroidales bacterium]